jgi:hypothetical protein
MDQGLGAWLVAGHGSVGAALARRLDAAGARVLIYDPAPRVAITVGEQVEERDIGHLALAGAMSSVPPRHALTAMGVIARADIAHATIFDWNTLDPQVKRRMEEGLNGQLIDVALLDSLDRGGKDTFIAISGSRVEAAARLLATLGFEVANAGPACGDAASVKLTRSLFMKSLEALVLEHVAITSRSPSREILRRSLERSLGKECADFFDLLVRTNRLHAERRAEELAEAVSLFEDDFPGLVVAPAAAVLLAAVAAAWAEPGSPDSSASTLELATFVRRRLHGE